MTYATDADRADMRTAPAVRCRCGHWAAVHVRRDPDTPCTANRCICERFTPKGRT